jgi:hypothetical protein
MKLPVFSINQREEQEKFSATLNRTYIIVYKEDDVSVGGLILRKEAEGFYSFITNRDFKMRYSEGINMRIIINDEEKIFYAKVGFRYRMKLYFFHKRLWIQSEGNIRWLLNMIIVILATYAAFSKK